MVRTAALAGVFLALLLIAAAYAAASLPDGPPPWAPWCLAVGTPLILCALMVLGASRSGGIGPLVVPIGLTFVLLVGAFGFALIDGTPPADARLWLGLPPRTAVILYGVGILPLLIVPVAYAVTFDRYTLDRGQLARLRARVESPPADSDR